jgi:hypothetical protein
MARQRNQRNASPSFEPLEARQLMSAVPVALRVLGADSATEGSGEGVRIMVSRAKALSQPTRVFFSIDGSATQPAINPVETTDYILDGMTVPDPAQPAFSSVVTAGLAFVIIPAGKSSTTFTLTPTDDSKAEGTEKVNLAIVPQGSYKVSDPSSATVLIHDNDFRINFQPAGAPTPPGYIADTGLPFGERARGVSYGWESDISRKAAIRNNRKSPDARYDSVMRMQAGGNHKWEIALPNGTYMVRLVAGDTGSINSVYGIRVENGVGLGGRPKGLVRFVRSTEVVQVKDGRLTLTNVLGSFNNKVNFIEIKSVARRTLLGQVARVSAPLKTQGTFELWNEQPNGLFSDNQIDEPLWADFGSSVSAAEPVSPASATSPTTPTQPVKPSLTARIFAEVRI